MLKLETLDYISFSAILIITFLAVIYGNLKAKDHSFIDHILMGRKLTLPLFLATLVATWYGGIFGVAQIAYEQGIYNFITQGVFWYSSYLIFAFFILPKIGQQKHKTLPELVKNEIGEKAGLLTAYFNIFNILPIAYIISLGLFIQQMFGLSLPLASFLGLFVVVLYSIKGGFRSVVYSDLIQFFIMFISVILVLIFSLYHFGVEPLLELPKSYFSPLGTQGLGETLIWGFIAIGTLIDPQFYQRSYAAINVKTAKTGILLATVFWMCFDLCLTFGAMYARAIMPEAGGEMGYIYYAIDVLPIGLGGLFLAGILATILSTLDSYLFLGSVTFSYDILKSQSIKKNMISLILLALFSYSLSLFFDGNIKKIWKLFGSLSTGSLLIPMLVFYRYRKITEKTFIWSTLGGASCVAVAFMTKSSIPPLYVGLTGSLIIVLALKLKQKLSA